MGTYWLLQILEGSLSKKKREVRETLLRFKIMKNVGLNNKIIILKKLYTIT